MGSILVALFTKITLRNRLAMLAHASIQDNKLLSVVSFINSPQEYFLLQNTGNLI